MTSPIPAEVASAIADLKTRWPNLNAGDRALAVHALHGAGVTLRELAKQPGCGATLLCRLDKAAQAPAEDIDLARKGQLSTRKLVDWSQAAEKAPRRSR
jgi:hypothetical protein